jgi:hypothetical protein
MQERARTTGHLVIAGAVLAHRIWFNTSGGVIVEGWVPGRGGCLEELVRGFVSTFADARKADGARELPVELGAFHDEDVVAVLLDDVCSLLDADGLVVVDVEEEHDDCFGGTFFVVPAEAVVLTGAGARGVCGSDLQFASDGTVWRGRVQINE